MTASSPPSLARRISVLVSGTLMAQMVQLGVTPILTRIFLPEDFGALALVNATVSSVVAAGALRLDMAIVVPRRQVDGANLLWMALASVLAFGALGGLVVSFARQPIARAMEAEPLADWLWFAPPIFVATAVYNALSFWVTRRARFRWLSIAAVLAALVAAGTKLSGGLTGGGAVLLLVGQAAGQVTAAVVLAGLVARSDGRLLRRSLAFHAWRGLFREHRDFPKYHAPMTLMNSVGLNLPVYVIGTSFSTTAVGHWAMTYALLSAPTFLVVNAVRQVFYQRGAELVNQGQGIFRLQWRSTLALAALAIPAGALGMWVVPTLLPWLLGEEWTQAGHLARVMLPWQVSIVVTAPSLAVFPVLKMQRETLVVQGLTTLAAAGSMWLVTAEGSVFSVATYAWVSAAMTLGLAALIHRRAYWHEAGQRAAHT